MTVKDFLESQGWAVNDLADRLGVHRLTIYQRQNSGWEIDYYTLNGKRRIGWTKPNGGVWFDEV